MNSKIHSVRLLFATAIVGAFAPFVYAGPNPPYWVPAKAVTTFSEAKAVTPEAIVTMQCKNCKTVMIRNSKHVGPPSKGHEEWFTIGSKHSCTECKGEITVVQGKTKDTMQHNCSKCGEGAVTCCVAATAEEPKK